MSKSGVSESLREMTAVFDARRTGEPLTIDDVTTRLEVSQERADEILQRLVDEGLLETKEVAPENYVWWRPTDVARETDSAPVEQLSTAVDSSAHGERIHSAGTEGETRPSNGKETDAPASRDERVLDDQRDGIEHEYMEVFERIDDAFFALDDEWQFTHLNERAADVLGRSVDGLVGRNIWEEFGDAAVSTVREHFERAVETQESVSFEKVFQSLGSWFEVTAYPSESGISVYFRDVTERKEREREIEARIRQQEAVADLGQSALEDCDLDVLMAGASEVVADVLDNDYCKVLDLDADAEELLLRQGVGWREGIVGEVTVSAVEDDSQASYTLQTSEPVVVTDLTTETRFSGPALLTRHDVRSGISVVIGPIDHPWGILGTHDTTAKEFTEQDVNFVRSVANILATAIKRHADEQVVVRQREQLAALNSLNQVAGEISDAVIDQSTREEIEAVVCERLVESNSYELAWIGEVDHRTQSVELRTEAGVENYLDDVYISVDPDDQHSDGPTGRALRTGEIQTSQDIRNDPCYEPWRDRAEEYGYRSSAAIPIADGETTYGVLNVYADRCGAFAGRERAVVNRLGEVVGHAIAAIERKRALMSDDVVELGFHIPNLFSTFEVEPLEGTVSFDEAIPIGDEEYLVYGTAINGDKRLVADFLEALPNTESVEFRDRGAGNDRLDFELHLTEPPLLSTIASVGGTMVDATVENGKYHITVQLRPGSGVRRAIDVVRATYPTAEMVTRRQTTRDAGVSQETILDLSESLTERQLAALRTAYHAGFFEWPREASGEDVATSLQVSAPTFHQHLRKAEQKVFDALVPTLV